MNIKKRTRGWNFYLRETGTFICGRLGHLSVEREKNKEDYGELYSAKVAGRHEGR